jgi:hypothetical protein
MNKYTLLLLCTWLISFSNITAQVIEEATTSSQPVDFVISGVSSGLIPGNDTIVLNQGPIPFGGGSGKLDSLDLNQDGIHDVAFNATICNTFDCIKSSTLCIGMHEGFNFVMGPMDAKQFDTADTVFANANWNAVPTPHKVGLFAQQGIGFNGFQSAGEWLNDNDGYLGFRLVTPASDTLLGWIHIYTYSQAENGAYLEILSWAIQHDPSQKPYAEMAKMPEKAVYCHGDYVIFEAYTIGAEQIMWHFWDGSSDSAATVTKILPDSTVTVTFEATNQNGTTTVTQTLEVSPLVLTAPDITLDCAHPTGTLTAETNVPAEICWVVGADTTCNPTPPTINFPLPITVIAEDEYGCIAVEQIDITMDANVPDVSIEYDEANQLLIAHSTTPDVTFTWISMGWPSADDTVVVSQSGTYTLVATAPNGCTSTTNITVVITSTGEPLSGDILIQPNPATVFLQIENRHSSDLHFKIFDPAGSLKLEPGTVTANSVSRLDIEFLPAGLYLLVGYDVGGKPLFFRKFVKQ